MTLLPSEAIHKIQSEAGSITWTRLSKAFPVQDADAPK